MRRRLEDPWGKTCRDPTTGVIRFHPLIDHCIDVAMVFRELLQIPGARISLQATTQTPLDEAVCDRLAIIAFLHDIGKCNRGFQAKADPQAKSTAGHAMEGAALMFDTALAALCPGAWIDLLESMCSWFQNSDEGLVSMLLASTSHHGRPLCPTDITNTVRWWSKASDGDPMVGVSSIAMSARTLFPAAFSSSKALEATPAFQQRFAGLVMLADWIGSDTSFFPYRVSPDEDRIGFARKAACRALRQIGLLQPEQRQVQAFHRTFGFEPNRLQGALANTVAIADTSRLMLVESETGSGKTEAALTWFLRLYGDRRVDGLYFALPTRVAARELYKRVVRTVDRAFLPPASPPGPVLLAVPGYARVEDHGYSLVEPDGVLWEDDDRAAQRERIWAAEHPKRFLAAPVAVGTIDQALLCALKVKHSLMRSVCLDRKLLVVDEVHASDAYMRELLHALIDGHLSRGGWVVLLSATLGESASARFFGRAELPLNAAIQRPYPSLTSRQGELCLDAGTRNKRVQVELHSDLSDLSIVPMLAKALSAGARVLAVCNTVQRANALFRAVEAAGIPGAHLFGVNGVACPHHGRFAPDDREVLDAAVSARLGKGSPAGPLLLIGTQTLEQSLDIDADWLVTDLCPMDVLLQRIGRLHRHRRDSRPPGFELPRVLVRSPGAAGLAAYLNQAGELKGPVGWGRVYEDGRILQRTLEVLTERPEIDIPKDNRWLVEQTTHPQALSGLADEWSRHANVLEGKVIGQVRAALIGTLEDRPFGELQYTAPDERVTTRLGAGALRIPLTDPVRGPFGTLVRTVTVPQHMAAPGGGPWPDRLSATATQDGFRFDLLGRHYNYSRLGLEIADA